MIDIFVSRPTWVAGQFLPGLDGFLTRLGDMDMVPRTLGASDYPTKSPLDEVIEIMEECQGAIILGYPQIHMEAGSIKGQAIEDTLSFPTEWNHIEAGLAYASSLPLLVIHHTGIVRGIFDRGAVNSFIYEYDLTDPAWSLDSQVTGALKTWRKRVEAVEPEQPENTTAAPPPAGSIACPNCSTPGQPFYLSMLEGDFQRITGSTHTCTRCNGRFNYS